MALIENAAPRSDIEDSGYYRLTGDVKIAELFQKVQSTLISAGTELEHYIEKYCKYEVCKVKETTISEKTGKALKNPRQIPHTTPTVEMVIKNYLEKVNSYFPKLRISKEELKEITDYDLASKKNIEIDGVWVVDGKIIITEYKDGFALDTKKSDGEIKMFKILEDFFKSFDAEIYIVLWNLKNIINNSIKSLEADKYVITGKDFSKLVGLDFDQLNKERNKDQKINEEYCINKFKEIIRIAA